MIVIDAVTPTAKELRPIKSGWGGVVHWLGFLPLYVGFLGFLVFGLVAMGPDGDAYPPKRLLDQQQLETLKSLIADLEGRGVLGAGVD